MISYDASATTSSAPSRQTVGTTSASILASNPARKFALVVNVGIYPVYLAFGQTPTTSAYSVPLAPCANSADDGTGGSYPVVIWDGVINAISTNAAGAVCVTEFTP
jgi:hypothetical protein